MKIAILAPKEEFTKEQIAQLQKAGEVVFVKERKPYPLSEIKKLVKGAVVLGLDPDILGGFDFAKEKINSLIDSTPTIKGIAAATTSTEYIDLEYCAKKGIEVFNIPGYAVESVVEQTIGMIIGVSKRIFLLDRREQKGKFEPEMGYEVKGKTLGIIGLGRIGSQVAKRAKCLGMKVIAWNRSPKNIPGIELVSLNELYKKSDIISLHIASVPETYSFIGEKEISKMKNGVMIVNLASRLLVDEKAMAKALKSGKVDSYVYEGDELKKGPLAEVERAFGFRIFSWYTKEALERLIAGWTDKILRLAEKYRNLGT